MNLLFAFLLLISISLACFTYQDKCYRFAGNRLGDSLSSYSFSYVVQYHYQYYMDKKGMPTGEDFLIHQVLLKNPEPAVKYYLKYYNNIIILRCCNVFSNCQQINSTFHCVSTCKSIWFRISNATSADGFVNGCDSIFFEKFADIA